MLTGILPPELIDLVIQFYSREDSDAAVLRAVSKTFYEFVPKKNRFILRVSDFISSIPRLSWARAQGCSWNEWTCMYAAGEGHLEVLKWARSQGCPWDEGTLLYAAEGGHLELLEWAKENGCPN